MINDILEPGETRVNGIAKVVSIDKDVTMVMLSPDDRAGDRVMVAIYHFCSMPEVGETYEVNVSYFADSNNVYDTSSPLGIPIRKL